MMPDAGWLVSALCFAVATSFTPGPNNTMVTASGANFGFIRSLPHMLGVTFGFPPMLALIGFGLGDLMRVPHLHGTLQTLGALYLLWLAYRIATAQPGGNAAGGARGSPLRFWQGALFQWINPKAWIIAFSAVTAYTATNATIMQSALLAGIFAITTAGSMLFWVTTGIGAARLLRTPRALRLFNVTMAGLLVLSLLPLLRE